MTELCGNYGAAQLEKAIEKLSGNSDGLRIIRSGSKAGGILPLAHLRVLGDITPCLSSATL